MGTLTMKFGGPALATVTTLTQVVNIIIREQQRWDRLLVVVSALNGVTDALIETARLVQLKDRTGYHRIVADLRTRHLDLVNQLTLDDEERTALLADIDRLLFDLLDICQNVADNGIEGAEPRALDRVIGAGELLTAQILATLLRQHDLRGVAIDTTDLIVVERALAHPEITLTRARIKEHLLPMLDRDIVPVITGFIAGTASGHPTTLGRGGSDFTASILSVCTDTTEMWMWTNVDGIMTADPHYLDSARVIPRLSYDEAAELAYFGARVLHTHMIEPLREDNIPLYIKNINQPQKPGTQVARTSAHPVQRVKAVTAIQGVGLIAHESGALTPITDMINKTLKKTIDTSADVMITAQSSAQSMVYFAIPTAAGTNMSDTIQAALEIRLQGKPELDVWQVIPVNIITAIGADLDQTPELIAPIFNALGDLPILALSQGPSHCSLSVVVHPNDTQEALARIHTLTEE